MALAEGELGAAPQRIDLNRATEVTPDVAALADRCFDYQPWDAGQIESGRKIREALAYAFKVIIDCAPPCPDRTVALRKLREARMDANSAITHHGQF